MGQYQTGRASHDYKQSKAPADTAAGMRAAKALGKSYPSQIGDIFRLGRAFGKLNAEEYYRYRLYDDAKYPAAAKARFLSDRIHGSIIAQVCDRSWWGAADDKFLAYTILDGVGATTPVTQAVFAPTGRNFGRLPCLRDIGQLRAFLAGPARYPLFAKPIAGIASFGAFLIEGYDAAADRVLLGGEKPVALAQFVPQMGNEDGYLLQEEVKPHPELARTCGPRIGTARIVLIVEGGKAEIIQTVLKIPAGPNIADNFWRSGNLLAAIDRPTGALSRIVEGTGPEQREIEAHPDTQQRLLGLRLPHWQKVLDQCLDYALVFSKLRYQSWDVAIGADGPIMIEVNTGASFMLSQVATGEGFLTDRFASFLAAAGFKKLAR